MIFALGDWRLQSAPWASVVLLLSTLGAFSQVLPSQVTPDTLRPRSEPAPITLESSGAAGLQAPAGAASLSFIVGRVVIEGGFPELERETSQLIAAIEGHRITVADVFSFATALEGIYGRAGYVLARVTVPPQSLVDHGNLRLLVVDGFIERVDAEKVPPRVRDLVTEKLAALIGRDHIKLAVIERQLLLAGDVPGLRLRSTLARGDSPGGALLVVDGTDRLVTATASVDDLLQDSLGTWNYAASAQINSPLGFGEQFYGSAQSGGYPLGVFAADSPLVVLGGGVVVPVGLNGWALNPEYTYSRSHPEPSSGGLDSVGYFQRFALRTSFPMVLTRSRTLTLNAAFEYIKQNVFLPLFDTDLNRDEYGVVRIGADGEWPWRGVSWRSSLTFSQGTGGRDAADAAATGIPLSRQGAGPLFSKLSGDVEFTAPLPGQLQFNLIGRAQTSFGAALMTSEQFSLDGVRAVSAYPSGSLSVDEGVTMRGEVRDRMAVAGLALPLTVTPYGFGVVAAGRLDAPTAGEVSVVRAAAVGVGLRSQIDGELAEGTTFDLEVARQFSNLPSLSQGWRGNLSVDVQF